MADFRTYEAARDGSTTLIGVGFYALLMAAMVYSRYGWLHITAVWMVATGLGLKRISERIRPD